MASDERWPQQDGQVAAGPEETLVGENDGETESEEEGETESEEEGETEEDERDEETVPSAELSGPQIQSNNDTNSKPGNESGSDLADSRRSNDSPTPGQQQRKGVESWPPEKIDAWLRYEGDYDQARWDRSYDVITNNRRVGTAWDNEVARINKYVDADGKPQGGYEAQVFIQDYGRRYDHVKLGPKREIMEIVENKSGRLDSDQLDRDTQALIDGRRVVYNLKTELPRSQKTTLKALQDKYPNLIVNEHYK